MPSCLSVLCHLQVGVAGPRARATSEMSSVAMAALGGISSVSNIIKSYEVRMVLYDGAAAGAAWGVLAPGQVGACLATGLSDRPTAACRDSLQRPALRSQQGRPLCSNQCNCCGDCRAVDWTAAVQDTCCFLPWCPWKD